MKLFYSFFFLLLGSFSLSAQSTISVNSADGYTVTLSLVPAGVVVTNPCPNGYNYNLDFTYDLQFSGTNIPTELYNLQARVGCGSNSHFLAIPIISGTGTITTSSNQYQPDCSVAPDFEALGCNGIMLVISGPGIPRQEIDASGLLPVELIDFVAEATDKTVEFRWATASEDNSDYFAIQRSTDLISWTTVVETAAAGQSAERIDYEATDYSPLNGTTYYRLAQRDVDGAMYYPAIVTVETKTAGFSMFPNPTTGELTVSGSQSVKIFNLVGREVLQAYADNQYGQVSLRVDNLPPGIYLVYAGDQVKRLIKK